VAEKGDMAVYEAAAFCRSQRGKYKRLHHNATPIAAFNAAKAIIPDLSFLRPVLYMKHI